MLVGDDGIEASQPLMCHHLKIFFLVSVLFFFFESLFSYSFVHLSFTPANENESSKTTKSIPVLFTITALTCSTKPGT